LLGVAVIWEFVSVDLDSAAFEEPRDEKKEKEAPQADGHEDENERVMPWRKVVGEKEEREIEANAEQEDGEDEEQAAGESEFLQRSRAALIRRFRVFVHFECG